MLETTMRIVRPGNRLYVLARRAVVVGPNLSVDLLERACGRLRHQHGLAATPWPRGQESLLVATDRDIPHVHMEDDEWELDVVDADEPTRRLTLADPEGLDLLPRLVERALQVTIARETDLWSSDSPRKWYEARPFRTQQGIAAFRRYEIGALLVDGVGVGVSVDVGTAFFTVDSVAYFLEDVVPEGERARRARSTTGTVRVKGRSYPSLLDYYRAELPDLPVGPDTLAVRVSFLGLSKPQWVSAERVRVRVMNDHVPRGLSSVDKIEPPEPARRPRGISTALALMTVVAMTSVAAHAGPFTLHAPGLMVLSLQVFLLMLRGIVVTNAVVLLDLVQHRIEAADDVHTALIQGGRTRVRPGVVLGQVRTNG